MTSRRTALGEVSTSTGHIGLWFDRYGAFDHEKSDSGKGKHVSAVATMPIPGLYRRFYDRWKQTLADTGRVELRAATILGRMVVGLGDESVLETSVTLHHTYGVPYIPGSALKGLAAAVARGLDEPGWRKDKHTGDAGMWHRVLFGDLAEAGYLTFFDALYVPRSGVGCNSRDCPLQPDVITVHHREYYGGQNRPPADWDSPNPVSFLTATGQYMIAIGGHPDWVKLAFALLSYGGERLGIGAKTSSGYGRFALELPSAWPRVTVTRTEPVGGTPAPVPAPDPVGPAEPVDATPAPVPAPDPSKPEFQKGHHVSCTVKSIIKGDWVCVLIRHNEDTLPETEVYGEIQLNKPSMRKAGTSFTAEITAIKTVDGARVLTLRRNGS